MAEGVDLYGKYNKVTDWEAVRAAGIEYAWIKLSDGNTDRDDYGYVAGGRGVGIVMGGYHYAQPGDPVAQADRLIGRCSAEGALDLAPALDLEDPFVPGAAAIQFSVRFLLRLAERGHVPVLYANQAMLSVVLKPIRSALEAAGVRNLKVWGARYGANLTMPVDVHQYSSKGRVSGITGDVDRNRGPILRNTNSTTEEDDDMTPEDRAALVNDIRNAVLDTAIDIEGKPGKKGNLRMTVAWGDAQWDSLHNHMNAIQADQAATNAAIAALSNDPDLDVDAIRKIISDAVRDHIQTTVRVQVGPEVTES